MVAVLAVGYRRLQVRHEHRADILLGFLSLACALICLNWLEHPLLLTTEIRLTASASALVAMRR